MKPVAGLQPTVVPLTPRRLLTNGSGRKLPVVSEPLEAGIVGGDVGLEVHADPLEVGFAERDHADFHSHRQVLQAAERVEQVFDFLDHVGGLVDDQGAADVVVSDAARTGAAVASPAILADEVGDEAGELLGVLLAGRRHRVHAVRHRVAGDGSTAAAIGAGRAIADEFAAAHAARTITVPIHERLNRRRILRGLHRSSQRLIAFQLVFRDRRHQVHHVEDFRLHAALGVLLRGDLDDIVLDDVNEAGFFEDDLESVLQRKVLELLIDDDAVEANLLVFERRFVHCNVDVRVLVTDPLDHFLAMACSRTSSIG